MTAEAVLDAFVATWVAHYGMPSVITTDRGVQLTSATWGGWCVDYGVQHITTTAFHPQANGMVERLHRQMKDVLRARGWAAAWADHIPLDHAGLQGLPQGGVRHLSGGCGSGHVLAILGQLLPSPPPACQRTHWRTLTALSVVIPVVKRTCTEAAATPALDAATHVYVQRGAWRRRWRTITPAPTWCWKRAPRSSSCSWERGQRSSLGTS